MTAISRAAHRYRSLPLKSPTLGRLSAALQLLLEESGAIRLGQTHIDTPVELPSEEEFARGFVRLDELGQLPDRMSGNSAQHRNQAKASIDTTRADSARIALNPSTCRIKLSGSLISQTTSNAPERLKTQAQELLIGFRDQIDLVVNTTAKEGNATFVDPALNLWNSTFGAAPMRYRPHDVYDGFLRMAAALYSVSNDLANETLKPQDFGQPDWRAIGPDSIFDLATARLEAGDSIQDNIDAMLADNAWQPISVHPKNGEPFALRPENINAFLERSTQATYDPNGLATELLTHDISNLMRAGATARAESAYGGDPSLMGDVAIVETLTEIAEGRVLPANATQVLFTLSRITRVPLLQVDVADDDATQAQLDAAKKRGEIVDHQELEGTTLVIRARTVESVASDMLDRVASGALNSLGQDTTDRVRQLVGPVSSPGLHLKTALREHADLRGWHELGADSIELVAVTFAVIETGGLAAGTVEGLEGGALLQWIARVAGGSAMSTTLNGFRGGELSLQQYATNLVLSAVLAKAAPLAQSVAQSSVARLGSPALTWLAGHASSVGASALIGTGFRALESELRGDDVSLERVVQELGRNLILISAVQSSVGTIRTLRPRLSAALRQESRQLNDRITRTMPRILRSLHRVAKTTERANSIPPEETLANLERSVFSLSKDVQPLRSLSEQATSFLGRVQSTR